MSEMQVMDPTGHTTVTWDAENREETKLARETFEEMVGRKHYRAFKVRKGGERGEPITAFDPTAEQMILLMPLAGG